MLERRGPDENPGLCAEHACVQQMPEVALKEVPRRVQFDHRPAGRPNRRLAVEQCDLRGEPGAGGMFAGNDVLRSVGDVRSRRPDRLGRSLPRRHVSGRPDGLSCEQMLSKRRRAKRAWPVSGRSSASNLVLGLSGHRNGPLHSAELLPLRVHRYRTRAFRSRRAHPAHHFAAGIRLSRSARHQGIQILPRFEVVLLEGGRRLYLRRGRLRARARRRGGGAA